MCAKLSSPSRRPSFSAAGAVAIAATQLATIGSADAQPGQIAAVIHKDGVDVMLTRRFPAEILRCLRL